MPSVNRLTIDRTVDIWHRMGRCEFRASEVTDLVRSPSQLMAMKNRGYLRVARKETGIREYPYKKVKYQIIFWQLTEQARHLAEEMEGVLA